MNKTILTTGCILGFLAVALGAFGAHGLEKMVAPDDVNTFETGVRYQMYHAIFLLVLAVLPEITEYTKRIVYGLVVSGVLFFSFSIYLLALNSMTSFDFRIIGFITPIGGTLLLSAWGYLGYRFYKSKLK